MATFWHETLKILNEASPYLLAGFLLAGLLDVLLGRFPRLTGLLTGAGRRPVFLAALLGAPLPLCSCSVLPAALTLRRQGATKGTTASFLISVPETDVTSITLTYALLGPFMAIARPVAAVTTAIMTGLIIDRLDPDTRSIGSPASKLANNGTSPSVTIGTEPVGTNGKDDSKGRAPVGRWFVRALRFGFVDMFDDIIVQLAIGIVVAGAIVAWLPGLGLEDIAGGSATNYLLMLVVGIPIYVCATASTPLALGFIAGGVSPGAALVFLLVGPATNVASLIVLGRQFGRLALSLYVGTLAVVSVALGVVLDIVLGERGAAATKALAIVAEKEGGAVPTVATLVLLVLVTTSLWRTKRLSKWLARVGVTHQRAS